MNVHNKYLMLLVLAIYFGGSHVYAGKIYSWLDENGQMQYSDRPPIGSHYSEKRIHSESGMSGTVGQRGLRHGEKKLIRKSNKRKSDNLSSRRAALKEHAAGKKRCTQLAERYRTLLGEPSDDNRKMIKKPTGR